MKMIMKHTSRHLFLIESISECEWQAHGTRVNEKYPRHQNEEHLYHVWIKILCTSGSNTYFYMFATLDKNWPFPLLLIYTRKYAGEWNGKGLLLLQPLSFTCERLQYTEVYKLKCDTNLAQEFS
jgi:hypothetical protein